MHCQDKNKDKDTYVHRYLLSRKITSYLCNETTDIERKTKEEAIDDDFQIVYKKKILMMK